MPKIAVCWRTSRDIRHHTCWTCSLRSCWTTLIVPVMGMMVVFRTQPSDLQSSFSQVFTWCLLSAGNLTSTRSVIFYSLLWIVRSGLLQMMGQSVIIGMSITDWLVLIPLLWDIQAGMLADTPGDVFACLVVPVQVLF